MSPPITKEQEEARFRDAGLTPQQRANVVAGIPSSPITAADLAQTPAPTVQQSPPPTTTDISKLPLAEIKGVDQTDPVAGLEEFERRISGFDVEEGIKTRTAKETRALEEINERIGLLQARAAAIPLEIQEEFKGRGVTRAGVDPIEIGRQRVATIEAMELSALAQAAQGKLLFARDLAKEAIKTQFEQLEREAANKRANIIANFDSFTPEQKRRAEETLRKLDANDAFLKEEKARKEQISDIALDFVSKGGDLATAETIRKTGDPVAAQALANQNLPKPSFREEAVGGFRVLLDEQGNKVATRVVDIDSNPPAPGTPVTDSAGNTLEYGTPEYITARLRATSGMKTRLVASEREQLGKFANVVALTGNLISSLDQTTNDPLLGYLRSLNPYDFDARAINAQVIALVPSVARGLYGEVGVLTDSDIERYLKTLPNIRSTADQNKFIAMMTLANARRSYEQTLLNAANSGVDVSGFEDSYQAMTNQLNTLEQELGAKISIPEAQTPQEKTSVLDSFLGQKTDLTTQPTVEQQPAGWFRRFLNIFGV